MLVLIQNDKRRKDFSPLAPLGIRNDKLFNVGAFLSSADDREVTENF